jgi:nucleotide-binding universal stress UspA family protein
MTFSAGGATASLDHHAGIHPTHARGMQHVLVCLDRSQLSETCLPHARFVADAFGAKITLLHVMASPAEEQPPSCPDPLGWELTRREASEYLVHVQDLLVAGGFVREQTAMEVTQGRPAERIVTLARELAADLTVIATHGEGGLGAWNLGSTAQQVLALAPSSVLVVPPRASQRQNASVKRIMVPLDGSIRTECVLPLVAQLARVHGVEILLVHVVTEPQPTAVLSTAEDLALARSLATNLEREAERYLARIRSWLATETSRVTTRVLRRTDERRALLEAAEDGQADLLVLAAHGASCDTERPFGTVAAHMLAHGKLPLLILQDLTETERVSSRPPRRESAVSGTRGSFGARALEGD